MPRAAPTDTTASTQNVMVSPIGPPQPVVVLFGLAQTHRVRRLLHARRERGEEHLLGVDQRLTAAVGELVLVRHRERPGRARLDAEPAEDAPQIVDLVRAPVALARGVAPLLGVVRAFDVDGVGRTRPGAELAPHALLQAVGPAVELVAAVEAGSRRLLLLRVV